MNIRDTIVALGGSSAVARRINYPRTTVQSWMVKNAIPRWQRPLLEQLTKSTNAPLRWQRPLLESLASEGKSTAPIRKPARKRRAR